MLAASIYPEHSSMTFTKWTLGLGFRVPHMALGLGFGSWNSVSVLAFGHDNQMALIT